MLPAALPLCPPHSTYRTLCRQEAFDGTGAAFVYPRGATLTVQRPAVAVLGSGKVAFPMHKALGECA